jgi:hypothetical protein
MRSIDRFRLDRQTEAEDSFSELWSADAKLGRRVPGTHLEAQYAFSDSGDSLFLLLTSYNSLFEEMLHVLLIDARGAIIEHAQLGAPYTSGVLKDVHVVAPNSLSFDFQGPARLTVRAKPRSWWQSKRLLISRPSNVKGTP